MNYLEQSKTILKICREIQDFIDKDRDIYFYSQVNNVFKAFSHIEEKNILDEQGKIKANFIESCQRKKDLFDDFYDYHFSEEIFRNHMEDNFIYRITKHAFITIISISLLLWGKEVNLNFINVEGIKDFSNLFYYCEQDPFNFEESIPVEILPLILKHSQISKREQDEFIDINALNLNQSDDSYTYFYVKRHLFNGFIDEWNLKNGTYFNFMFCYSYFNQHELHLDLSSAEDCHAMFSYSKFDKKLVIKGQVKEASKMFFNAHIRQSIEMDLSKCDNFFKIFHSTPEFLEKEKLKDFTLEQFSKIDFGLLPNKNIENFRSFELREFIPVKVFRDIIEQNKPSNLKTFLESLEPIDIAHALGLKLYEINDDMIANNLNDKELLSACKFNLDKVFEYYNFSFFNLNTKEYFIEIFSTSFTYSLKLLLKNDSLKNNKKELFNHFSFLKTNANAKVFKSFLEENKNILTLFNLLDDNEEILVASNKVTNICI